jgi:hypothetical protein
MDPRTLVIPPEVAHILSNIPILFYLAVIAIGVAVAIGFGLHYWDLTHGKKNNSNIGCY